MTAHPLKRLERAWYMARHVGSRQLLRRAHLRTAMWLEQWSPPRLARPPLAVSRKLVGPFALPAAAHLVDADKGTLYLVMPWARCRLWPEPEWHMHVDDEAAMFLRAALHNMEYLSAIDDRTALALLASWWQNNPFERCESRRYAWRPFNLSIRVVAAIKVLASCGDSDAITWLSQSVTPQVRYLVKRLETDIRGNHLIKNITALLWAGTYFCGSEAESWRERGMRLLDREIDEQVLHDGGHVERSPTYQCQVITDLLTCRVVLDQGPLRDRLDEALRRMGRALEYLTHPDEEVALLNDGGLHASWPARAVFAGLAAAGLPRLPERKRVFALPDTGYWGLKSGGDYIIIDCGPLGPDYLVGHGHADILAFEWSTGGRRVIVDKGTYCYNAGERRIETRSTRSHNTVTINGAEQSDVYDAFRCGRRAKARVLAFREESGGFLFCGTHDGFVHLPGRPRHERTIVAREGELEIRDRIWGNGRIQGTASFLLHPECRCDKTDGGIMIRCEDVVVAVTASQPVEVQSAEWYPDMFVTCPTSRLVTTVPSGEAGLDVKFRRIA